MIIRSAILVICSALAYAMLRGWPEVFPLVMRVCAAVLAMVAGIGIWTRRRGGKSLTHAAASRLPDRLDFASIAAALLVVECGFLWLLIAAPAPLETVALAVERRLRPEAAAMRTLANHQGPAAGNWLWNEETSRPLPRRTDFKPGRKPEVFLRIPDPADAAALLRGRIYVRAFALGRYGNSAWSALPGRPLVLKADDSGFIRLAAPRPGREIVHEVFHPADPKGKPPLTALQGATEAGVFPLERIDDGLHLLPPPTEPGGYRYIAKSTPIRLEDLPADALVRAWPDAPGELLAVPGNPGFGSDFKAMARAAAGEGSTQQQLLRLQQYLRQNHHYSLETPNVRDLDPMENFFFGEKRGHCEYFATAGALMARALGLPSRVAYGWAGGTWYESAGLFVFRANEAHAWTELWLENFGWVVMDPTPLAGSGERAQVAAPHEKPPTAQPDTESPESPAALTGPGLETRLPLALALLSLPVAIVLVVLRSHRGKHGLAGAIPGGGPGGRSPGYLHAWHHACIARGLPVTPGITLKRQLRTMPDAPDFAADLLAYHYGTRYEDRPADPSLEKRLTRLIRGWESAFSGINPPRKSSQDPT